MKEKHHKSQLTSSGRLDPLAPLPSNENEDIDVVDDETKTEIVAEDIAHQDPPETTLISSRKESPAASLFSMASLMKKSEPKSPSKTSELTPSLPSGFSSGGFLPSLGLDLKFIVRNIHSISNRLVPD